MSRTPDIESAARAVEITASDSAVIAVTRGIYIGVTGNLKVDMMDGSTVTFVGMAAGMIHPIRAKKIYSTGTTTASIIAVY